MSSWYPAPRRRLAFLEPLVRRIERTPAVHLARLIRGAKLAISGSRRVGLEDPIAAEIRDDEFWTLLEELAARPDVRTILEIGASSGDGSTEALIRGALRNPAGPAEIHTLELSRARFARLAARWERFDFVKPHNLSSVELDRFPRWDEIARFHRTVRSRLSRIPLSEVRRWYHQDIAYVLAHGPDHNGVLDLMRREAIDSFDLVLIDGSEFTGAAELQDVYGARLIALDDAQSFKNFRNVELLLRDPGYRLFWTSDLRNGFAVFERID